MIRMLSGPSLVVATTERGTPSASVVVVAMRNPGAAAAMRAAASSCASSSADVKAGFVIFTTPTGSPPARARKFWSCWLPSGARSTSSPHCARTISATSATGRLGAGSSPAPKKSNPTVPEAPPLLPCMRTPSRVRR